jgi:endonuclease/exonuclease/phosphatase family metal-dependent hydrolase
MNFRFASWNVNNRNFTKTHASIFRELGADVIALQEVSPTFHASLDETQLFSWSSSSFAIRPCKEGEGRARRLGCSLLGSKLFLLLNASLVPRLAFPERSLVASLETRGRQMTVCSFHAPPGTNWGEIKPRTLKAIGRWLARQPPPLVFGIDANAPKTDHPDISCNKWWWEEELLLLGATPLHELKDSLRLFLDANPAEFARAVRARPNGPLAVSHIRGNRLNTTECRYDFIYVTSDIQVRKVQYNFGKRIRAISDHALVIADLEV